VFLILDIDRIGISRTNQWKNLQGPIGVVLALVLLGEFVGADLLKILLGALLVFLSALALSVPTGGGEATRSNDRRGILLALSAALVFGLAAAYTKLFASAAETPSLALGASLGFAAVSWGFILFRRQLREALRSASREWLLALTGGIIFAASIWTMALTFRYLPVSVGYTIIQLNSVWVVLAGVLWFREISFQEHGGRILLGLALAIMGVLVLAF
jgi:drug/metabolite transporter (DMT)-like permease